MRWNCVKNIQNLHIKDFKFKPDNIQQIRHQYENDDIPVEPKNSGLLLLLFEFNNFSFLKDIIDNIIDHVTRTPTMSSYTDG